LSQDYGARPSFNAIFSDIMIFFVLPGTLSPAAGFNLAVSNSRAIEKG
jgi:hypothetical protein